MRTALKGAQATRLIRSSPKTSWSGLGAVLFGASMLGFSAIFVKWAAAGGATPLTVGFYRMAIALPGALVLMLRAGGLGAAKGRNAALFAGAAFFLDLWLWHEAMRYTTAANATLLVGGLSPVWVALFSVFALGARPPGLTWLGLSIGVGGALVLALAKGARVGTGLGEGIAIAASFCYATFTLGMIRARRTLSAPQALFWMSAGCLVCFAAASAITAQPMTGYDPKAWVSLLGLGFIVQLLAWWFNSWGLGRVDAALGALALQAQQVATLFLAAWLLDEPLRPLGLVGGGMILCGILVAASSPARGQGV